MKPLSISFSCLLLLSLALAACEEEQPTNIVIEADSPARQGQAVGPDHPYSKEAIDDSTDNQYPWLQDYDIQRALLHQVSCPKGATRPAVEAGSFADWLRYLPLKPANAAVYFFNGTRKPNQSGVDRVVNIDVGSRDLQQCADAVIRLRAEYLFSKKDYKSTHFNFTSGHKVGFDDWAQGRKPLVKGNRVRFSSKTGARDYSYANFKKYLDKIFMFAGTASLDKELPAVSVKDLQIGDVFIQGGFPGHAVLVLDLAVDSLSGKKYFLLGQSYMPAQDFHLLRNPSHPEHSPWYELPFGQQLLTPDWSFSAKDLHRFK